MKKYRLQKYKKTFSNQLPVTSHQLRVTSYESPVTNQQKHRNTKKHFLTSY